MKAVLPEVLSLLTIWTKTLSDSGGFDHHDRKSDIFRTGCKWQLAWGWSILRRPRFRPHSLLLLLVVVLSYMY